MLNLASASHVVALNPLSSTSLLASLGALGVFLALFAETGLLIGFFLPGDSLLFTAGLLCASTATHKAHLSLPLVLLAAAGGALLGAQTGFIIGRKGGRAWLQRTNRRFLHRGAERSEELLGRYGYGKAIVLARFIPVVRTILNPMVGALDVPVRTFTVWQVVGGLIWSLGVTLAGYALGSTIGNVDKYLLPIIALIVIISLLPLVIEFFRNRKRGGTGGAPSSDWTAENGQAAANGGAPAGSQVAGENGAPVGHGGRHRADENQRPAPYASPTGEWPASR
ncbi:MAG TPA: DedA family protein [Streptosporangiaceae bacterium]